MTCETKIQPRVPRANQQQKRLSRNPIKWARNASQSIRSKVINKVTSINHKLKRRSTQPIKNKDGHGEPEGKPAEHTEPAGETILKKQ